MLAMFAVILFLPKLFLLLMIFSVGVGVGVGRVLMIC